jgi:hypothetical protein
MASEDIVDRLREQSDEDSSPETLCLYAAEEIELLRSRVSRWIPVGERLPDDGVWVLYQDGFVASPNPGGTPQAIHIGIVLNGEWCDQSYRLVGGRQNPICWMPIPEMHKETT